MFGFSNYNVEELRACATAFREDFLTARPPITTPAVLEWFMNTAPAGIRTYCSPKQVRQGYYEFLVDLCHTTFPLLDCNRSRQDWYREAFSRDYRIRLALESEWGDSRNSKWEPGQKDWRFGLIIDDASKLAVVRADVKIMVFQSSSHELRESIANALASLRSSANDSSPWLWIDVAWYSGSKSREIAFGIIESAP